MYHSVPELRTGFLPAHFCLPLLVLIRLIDHESASILRQLAPAVVAFVPFGTGLEDEDTALICPSELHKPGLANVRLQPAAFFQIFFAAVITVGEQLGERVKM